MDQLGSNTAPSSSPDKKEKERLRKAAWRAKRTTEQITKDRSRTKEYMGRLRYSRSPSIAATSRAQDAARKREQRAQMTPLQRERHLHNKASDMFRFRKLLGATKEELPDDFTQEQFDMAHDKYTAEYQKQARRSKMHSKRIERLSSRLWMSQGSIEICQKKGCIGVGCISCAAKQCEVERLENALQDARKSHAAAKELHL